MKIKSSKLKKIKITNKLCRYVYIRLAVTPAFGGHLANQAATPRTPGPPPHPPCTPLRTVLPISLPSPSGAPCIPPPHPVSAFLAP